MKKIFLSALVLAATAIAAGLAPESDLDLNRTPDAVVDLATMQGVQLMKAQWRYSDTRIIETEFRAAGADGQPGESPAKTFDFTPHAGAADFDDSSWGAIDPTTLSQRRGSGGLGFNWYRINLTIPDRVGQFDTTGSTVSFATSIDDYAEVWVNGELTRYPGQSGGWPAPSRFDPEALRVQGFTGPQVAEAVAVCGISNFLNTVQTGVGAVPDFTPRHVFTPRKLYPEPGVDRLSVVRDSPPSDPDQELVVKVQAGDSDAFEELARRHAKRIFATLVGMLGNREEARDAMQDVFLKAFQHIAKFQGRSKFSTWLTSIAINTGTEALRQRRDTESLDEPGNDEDFRPRQVKSWTEDPEQLLAAAQMRDLVQKAVQRLPYIYRVVVILRDINQLSTEEAAAALELKVPALKARLLRGRLMLREALAPHFIKRDTET